jgi:hypothetical protein
VGARCDVFAASGTWTPPTGVTSALVLCVGGGGGTQVAGGGAAIYGGRGGVIYAAITGISGAVTVTVGAGGIGGTTTAGGTSSFGSFVTSTGGGQGGVGVQGVAGSGSTTGTILRKITTAHTVGNVIGYTIPFFTGETTARLQAASSSAALAWSASSIYYAGSPAQGTTATVNITGGIGGVVMVFY